MGTKAVVKLNSHLFDARSLQWRLRYLGVMVAGIAVLSVARIGLVTLLWIRHLSHTINHDGQAKLLQIRALCITLSKF